LDPEIGAVEDEYGTTPIHSQAIWKIKLTGSPPEPPPLGFIFSIPIKILDPVFAGIGDV
jgi:hypothetical protein